MIVGAGNVGSTTAFTLLLSGLAAEIVIIDLNKKKAEGEAMDLNHAAPLSHETRVYLGDYKDCKDATAVVITAGKNQKPGETRMDLLKANISIFKEILREVTKYTKDAILLVATNPVDVLTYATLKLTGFPAERVIGSGTIIDTARFQYLIGKLYGLDPQSVNADIIGEHGDSELAVWSHASIAGLSLADFCEESETKYDEQALNECFKETKNAAYDIIQRKGSTEYGVAAGLVRILAAIIRDENALLTVSGLDSYSNIGDVCFSMPRKLNKDGAHRIINAKLSKDEDAKLVESVKSIKHAIESIGLN